MKVKILSIGHAGFLLKAEDVNILIDPWFYPAFFNTWFPYPNNRFMEDVLLNEKIDYFPSSIESDSIKPIYKSFKGWTSKSNHARLFDDLEDNFKKYINFIESEVGVSINLVSLGPDREETIYMK